ncbi:unnamed protein product [Hymenolepis diminuta]|uniref:Integrase catalytic domain-containing protein n=1 Tax=Hymenolepis diminuta TaxID=6216 RepID=A0A564YBZ1_HYMDI|nr:unnamed protein product [Hymenolepis diminuta]
MLCLRKIPSDQQLILRDKTSVPWYRIRLNFVRPVNGLSYLVVVGSHSKWHGAIPLQSTKTTMLIGTLCHKFPIYELLETIVTDNGIQFSSALFQDFCWSHNIIHVYSPSYYPQSNEVTWGVDNERDSRRIPYHDRTTPHPASNDRSPPIERKLRTIDNGLLPKDFIFLSLPLYTKKALATRTAVYLHDHGPNDT